MRQPEKHQGQNSSIENSEVVAFANYVRLIVSKLDPTEGNFARQRSA